MAVCPKRARLLKWMQSVCPAEDWLTGFALSLANRNLKIFFDKTNVGLISVFCAYSIHLLIKFNTYASVISVSGPVFPIQRAVTDRFGGMSRLNIGRAVQIGDCTGHLEHAVVGARRKAKLFKSVFEQRIGSGRSPADFMEKLRWNTCIACDGRAGKAL